MAETKADREQTKSDHRVARLNKRLEHEAEAARFEQAAQVHESKGDRRGAALLRDKALVRRNMAKAFL